MNMSKEISMHDLNPQQKEALAYTDSPLLVFAGAGSGKTKSYCSQVLISE